MNLRIALFALILSHSLYAQNNELALEGGMVQVRIFEDTEESKDYEGSPYIFEDFSDARINSSKKIYKVRYNAYTDQVEVMTEDGAHFILDYSDKNYEIYFQEKGQTLKRIRFANLKESFGFILWEGDGKQLIKTYKKNFIPAKEADGYKNQTRARFTGAKEEYYLLNIKTKEAKELPGSKNKIFKEVFSKGFKDKAKSLDLDPREEGDLIELLNIFYLE